MCVCVCLCVRQGLGASELIVWFPSLAFHLALTLPDPDDVGKAERKLILARDGLDCPSQAQFFHHLSCMCEVWCFEDASVSNA